MVEFTIILPVWNMETKYNNLLSDSSAQRKLPSADGERKSSVRAITGQVNIIQIRENGCKWSRSRILIGIDNSIDTFAKQESVKSCVDGRGERGPSTMLV